MNEVICPHCASRRPAMEVAYNGGWCFACGEKVPESVARDASDLARAECSLIGTEPRGVPPSPKPVPLASRFGGPFAEPTTNPHMQPRLSSALLGAALGGLGLLVVRGEASPVIMLIWAIVVAKVLGDDLIDRRTHPRILTPGRLASHLCLLGVGLWCLFCGHNWVLSRPPDLDTYWVVFRLDAMAPGLLGMVVLGLVFRVNIFAGGPLDMNRDAPISGK